ncbi:MAG TPA: hypothetical protein VM536_23510, partial [Chloroflexia bacterium]|nr:hypothetical protein [Chloroflexia bacterium]
MVLRNNTRTWLTSAGLGLLLGSLALAGAGIGSQHGGPSAPSGRGSAAPSGQLGEPASLAPGGTAMVGYAVKHDQSPALRDIVLPAAPSPRRAEDNDRSALFVANGGQVKDSVAQRTFGNNNAPLAIPAPSVNFEGVGNIGGWYPPDTTGDVGPNNFVQMVNDHFQIWDKSGRSLYGPVPANAPWAGFGGACDIYNDGDPIVNYDPIADRWVLSQFAVPGGREGYHQCFAVSTTGDPTGGYYRYDFLMSNNLFDDYPKVGVWPDAYYATFNMFSGNHYAGPWAVAYDRAKMLTGAPAGFQYFSLNSRTGPLLPADLDGATLPPAGTPGLFANYGTNSLNIWRLHVDWATPANSTFTGPTTLATAPFNQLCPTTYYCVRQPGTTVALDSLGDRLMYRLAYRNMGTYQTMLVNHSVDVGGGQ